MAKPPVCKIMDYGKFKYEEKKKANDAKKKQIVKMCIRDRIRSCCPSSRASCRTLS